MDEDFASRFAEMIWPTFTDLVVTPGHEYRCEYADSHPALVVVDAGVLGGRPCMAGSRLPVATLLGFIERGDAWDRILQSWPWLTAAHVAAASEWVRVNG
jgi:uncharacterized protein (DUF433 family)